MKASREYKQWIKNLRSRYGARNGTISTCCLEHPDLVIHLATDKKNQPRYKRQLIEELE
jgi:hypothetical protein